MVDIVLSNCKMGTRDKEQSHGGTPFIKASKSW
jgi:hypothetical protein